MTANEITAQLLIEIPKRFPGVRIWRNNRVDAMVTGRNSKPRRISAGLNGQADISGIAGPKGKRLEVEVKAGRDRQSEAQKNFAQMITDHGGWYLIARDVQETLARIAFLLGD